jgi:hypothetical protein
MHEESGGVGRVFDPFPLEKHLAPMLRRDLKRAGVVRAELFVTDKTRKQMTFHDLRSTGITWMAMRGDEPLKIKQRAGHKQFSTTEGYIREAESVREGFGVPFPPLPEGLVSSGISSERLGANGHVYKIKGENGVGEAGFESALLMVHTPNGLGRDAGGAGRSWRRRASKARPWGSAGGRVPASGDTASQRDQTVSEGRS